MLFEDFEHSLRDALSHLYDPAFRPDATLRELSDCGPGHDPDGFRAALVRHIEGLKPGPDVPPAARSRRLYDILCYRYTQGLTQEETARRLNITSRHLRREQQEAVAVLARRLWELGGAQVPTLAPETLPEEQAVPVDAFPAQGQTAQWRAQLQAELASLRRSSQGSVADVGEVVRSIVELQQPLAARHGAELRAAEVEAGLLAAIHPSALRQVLVLATISLMRATPAGRISIGARREQGFAQVTVVASPSSADFSLQPDLMREILEPLGASWTIHAAPGALRVTVELPLPEQVTVLVIDDNLDLVHFYRRYTAGTRYQILHVAEGEGALQAIASAAPQVIVLDVMLPDVDGWQLLAALHEHPAACTIPIIVCSVIRQEELALALGAAMYLPKPVHRGEFVAALNRALAGSHGDSI